MPKHYSYSERLEPQSSAGRIMALVPPRSKVLEVGCAAGVQTRHLNKELHCRVTGIEINADAAAQAQPYCERLLVGNVEDDGLLAPLQGEAFEVIIVADVLEHLLDPLGALVRLRPLLGEGGVLLASIPNIAHAAICWEIAHGRFDYRAFGLLDDTHIKFFTRSSIVRLFEQAGFSIASWDRVTVHPKDTEFSVIPFGEEQERFLAWIGRQNPESDTYQFIVKVVPSSDSRMLESKVFDLQESQRGMKRELDQLRAENVKLRSEMGWLEARRFGPLTPAIKLVIRVLGMGGER